MRHKIRYVATGPDIMALDQQRNWTISMAENLEQAKSRGKQSKPDKKGESHEGRKARENPVRWPRPPVYLPDEIVIHILEYVCHFRQAQYTLASCCLLSNQWYSAAVPFLYARPWITGRNFDAFERAICPSKNLHVRKSPLAELVKLLDMSQLIHSSSRPVTARLLGRTKNNLEEFIAPQASFGQNSFPALGKCQNLELLDLSLVSESPPLPGLFKAISHLHNLKSLRLPRSSGFNNSSFDASTMTWPPNLESLCLSGGIDVHFLQGVVSFPDSLKSLTIEHCPMAKTTSIMYLLRTAVRPLPNLDTLKLSNLPRLSFKSLDDVLLTLPGLTKLSISVDYITPALFDLSDQQGSSLTTASLADLQLPHQNSSVPETSRHRWSPGRACQLRTLELTNSGNPGIEDKISPIDILISVQDGTLPHLRQVRVANSLYWHSESNAAETEALTDGLKELAIEQGEESGRTGVWTFEG